MVGTWRGERKEGIMRIEMGVGGGGGRVGQLAGLVLQRVSLLNFEWPGVV